MELCENFLYHCGTADFQCLGKLWAVTHDYCLICYTDFIDAARQCPLYHGFAKRKKNMLRFIYFFHSSRARI